MIRNRGGNTVDEENQITTMQAGNSHNINTGLSIEIPIVASATSRVPSQCEFVEAALGITPSADTVLKPVEPLKDRDFVSFKVVCVDIGSWSPHWQYLYCTFSVIFFLLMYGVLQEYVVMNEFKRSLSWFVTLIQLTGYAVCGIMQSYYDFGTLGIRKIPTSNYMGLAALQLLVQGFSNYSMHYLNYPAKTLFKSSRVTMTMLFGALFMNRKYSRNDYIVAACIITGLFLFVLSDAQTSPYFDKLGVLYILLSLIADAASLNFQEYCLDRYKATHDELVMYTYMYSSVISLLVCILTGEFWTGVTFLQETGSSFMLFVFFGFLSVGYLGMSATAALTKRFGAITSAITSTIRKGLTLVLSFICFPHDKELTLGHILGTSIFMSGLGIRILATIRMSQIDHQVPDDAIDDELIAPSPPHRAENES